VMSTYGRPYFFEDTTGLASGPTDFLDIYDRPPFLRLTTSHPPNLKGRPTIEATRDGRTLKIFELGSRALGSRRLSGEEGTPSAVISFDSANGFIGTVRFRGEKPYAIEKWLKKSSTFGRYAKIVIQILIALLNILKSSNATISWCRWFVLPMAISYTG